MSGCRMSAAPPGYTARRPAANWDVARSRIIVQVSYHFQTRTARTIDVGPNESWHKRCQQAVRVLVCMSYSDLAVGERSFKESLDSSRKIWRIVHYEESKHVPPEASSPVMVAASILKISRASGLPDL